MTPQPADTPHVLDPQEREFIRALGKRIRLHRIDAELSQQDVAHRARMSRNAVSAAERGRHSIDIVRMTRLAAALGVTPHDLIPPNDQPPRLGGQHAVTRIIDHAGRTADHA